MAALAGRGLPGFRLPTEAEWAWAARCGVPTRWVGGDRVKAVAVVDSNQTALVAGLSGAAVGVFDFSGNVFEWAEDWYTGSPLAGVDIQGPASGSNRVSRGGSWGSVPRSVRVAYRYDDGPGNRNYYLGVRLIRTAP